MCACVPACVIYTYRLLKGSPSKEVNIRQPGSAVYVGMVVVYIYMYLMVNII